MAFITSINSSTNAVISGSDYAVNAIGQRTGITRSGSATPGSASAGYTYNNRGELIAADEATNAMDRAYQYDGIGNREKSANSLTLPGSNNYTVNALNQYTAVNLGTSVSPVHDDDGNATAYPLPVNLAANAALTYDGENRLIKVITGSTTVEYIYDAFSRRVAKTVGSTRTYYIYDGWNCVAEYTGAIHTSGTAPALTRTYTHTWGLDLSGSMQGAGGVGGLLMSSKFTSSTTATAYLPLFDGNGNITAYIDNACAVEASFDYDPFGNITNNNNPLTFTYAFSTKPLEVETGLYYFGYRWYDPQTGRWINRDPIEERGGFNIYHLLGNDVINKTDYLGYIDSEIWNNPDNKMPLPNRDKWTITCNRCHKINGDFKLDCTIYKNGVAEHAFEANDYDKYKAREKGNQIGLEDGTYGANWPSGNYTICNDRSGSFGPNTPSISNIGIPGHVRLANGAVQEDCRIHAQVNQSQGCITPTDTDPTATKGSSKQNDCRSPAVNIIRHIIINHGCIMLTIVDAGPCDPVTCSEDYWHPWSALEQWDTCDWSRYLE